MFKRRNRGGLIKPKPKKSERDIRKSFRKKLASIFAASALSASLAFGSGAIQSTNPNKVSAELAAVSKNVATVSAQQNKNNMVTNAVVPFSSFTRGSSLARLPQSHISAILRGVRIKSSPLSKKQINHNKSIYLPMVKEAAKKHGVSETIMVKLIQHESMWDPYVVGKSKDIGLGQLTPVIWNSSIKPEYKCNPFNPKQNIDVAAKYYSYLYKKFKNHKLALTAYNQGETIVRKKLREGKSLEVIANENPNKYASKVLNQKL
ncbi:MAG: transglycosylase SLT domain-containing protein [Candidatus Diapherotrites archaeon]|jgi:soluble lytic murein transglycosylase-like protein|uniref:Transglycosylase SLT domain-containing protein n=1 Tax=Candidatus Iainarchaeum sp. TaxID=3101447 RepID=A0A7K4C025_9ARCH|nr:transglycosylase SLT domain-containing protein [Candidatus Diapherotrites archaeon]